MFNDALIGNREGDYYFGTRSARIRDGFIEMRFDYPDGTGLFSFYGANSGFSGDTGGTVQVYYSTNQGSSWHTLGGEIALTEEGESQPASILFSSDEPGLFEDRLILSSNDPDNPIFELQVQARVVDENEVIPVAVAREVPFGTRVTVGGQISVANEFDGPVFLQDETAGIATFHVPLHRAVERGDSVIVTGPVTEFNPIDGNSGTFLRQISAIQGDPNVSFEIVDTPPEPVEPTDITVADKNAGEFESRLVTIKNATFRAEGALQGNQNYTISDQTGTGTLRIDNSISDIIGASIPDEPTDITGVVDRFNGVYQIKPRDADDLTVQSVDLEGEDVPQNLTFDVVTWNIEWFGVSDRGPSNINLQMNNVIEVVKTINADLYAFRKLQTGRFSWP